MAFRTLMLFVAMGMSSARADAILAHEDQESRLLSLSSTSPWPMFRGNIQGTGRSSYSGPSTSNLKWRYSTDSLQGSSPAIGSDGTLYIGSTTGNVYALSGSSASTQWTCYIGGSIYSTPAIGSDGTIYVSSSASSSHGYLNSISSSGTLQWQYQVGQYVYSSPVISSDDNIYFGSQSDYYLYAVSTSGTLQWKYGTTGTIYASAAIDTSGNVYVGCLGGYLYALTSSGTLSWNYNLGSGIYNSPTIGSDSTIYVASNNGYLNAISSSGTLSWRYLASTATYPGFYASPVLGSDDTVYIGNSITGGTSYFFAISSSGTLKWNAAITVSGAASVGSDGMIYVGSTSDLKLYAFDSSGTYKWTYGSISPTTPTSIGSDGTLYIGAYETSSIYVYAFSSSTGSPTSAPNNAPTLAPTMSTTSTPAIPTYSPTASPTQSSGSTSSSSSSKSSSSTTSIAIGAGVGGGVGALLIFAIVWYRFRSHGKDSDLAKKRISAAEIRVSSLESARGDADHSYGHDDRRKDAYREKAEGSGGGFSDTLHNLFGDRRAGGGGAPADDDHKRTSVRQKQKSDGKDHGLVSGVRTAVDAQETEEFRVGIELASILMEEGRNRRASIDTSSAASAATAPTLLIAAQALENLSSIVSGSMDIVATQPFIGPFAILLKKCVGICESFKINKSAAAAFLQRLGEVSDIVAMAMKDKKATAEHMESLAKYVDELTETLREACGYFEAFTNAGFLQRLLVGEQPRIKFEELDQRMTRTLSNMMAALALSQQALQSKTYDVVCNIESLLNDMGGFSAIREDAAKMSSLAKKLGVNPADLREEITTIDVHLERMEELFVKRFDDIEGLIREGLSSQQSLSSITSDSGTASDESECTIDMNALTVDRSTILGFGAFGNVYAGTMDGNIRVAVKTCSKPLDRDALTDLKKEVKTLKLLSMHPGVVRMYGANFDVKRGDLCIVFEQATCSLYDYLHKRGKFFSDLSLAMKIYALSSIAKTMQFITGANLVHRDIKSQNVLVFVPLHPSGVYSFKLADFGIAKQVNDQTTMLSTKGTPAYMSPELFNATRGNIPYSSKSDVYAYGILVNEMMTEAIPFDGEDVFRIRDLVKAGKRPDRYVATARNKIGIGIRSLIDNCLFDEPSQRISFEKIVTYLAAVSAEAVKLSQQGCTATIELAPLDSEENGGRNTKPLKDLSLQEVITLLQSHDVPEEFLNAVQREKFSGRFLSHIKSADELGSELQFAGVSKLQLRVVYDLVAEYQTSGVPNWKLY